jgi:hypothetical protein
MHGNVWISNAYVGRHLLAQPDVVKCSLQYYFKVWKWASAARGSSPACPSFAAAPCSFA